MVGKEQSWMVVMMENENKTVNNRYRKFGILVQRLSIIQCTIYLKIGGVDKNICLMLNIFLSVILPNFMLKNKVRAKLITVLWLVYVCVYIYIYMCVCVYIYVCVCVSLLVC